MARRSISPGRWFKPVSYGVRKDDNRIDMEQVERLAQEHKPKLIIAGGSGYPRFWDFEKFRQIADSIGAYFFVDMAHFAVSWQAACIRRRSACPCRDFDNAQDPARPARRHRADERRGHCQEDQFGGLPRPPGRPADACHRRQGGGFGEALKPDFKVYARQIVENAKALAATLVGGGYAITSGGTDNHLMLVDLRPKSLTGKAAEASLGRAHITCNKNGVPFDTASPMVTSGIRLGTPAGTSRGFGVAEFKKIGELIIETLDGLAKNGEAENGTVEAAVKKQVEELTQPLPDLLMKIVELRF